MKAVKKELPIFKTDKVVKYYDITEGLGFLEIIHDNGVRSAMVQVRGRNVMSMLWRENVSPFLIEHDIIRDILTRMVYDRMYPSMDLHVPTYEYMASKIPNYSLEEAINYIHNHNY